MNSLTRLLIVTFVCASSVLGAMAQTRQGLSTEDQLALSGIYYAGAGSVLEFQRINDETANLQSDDPVSALSDYYRSINTGQLRRAFSYWETPAQTLEQFTRGFTHTKTVRILLDPSPLIEGAAGSSYANIASIVISTQMNGAEQVFAGCYVMRKSNVRGEEEPDKSGWRIYKASLAPVSGKLGPVLTQTCK